MKKLKFSNKFKPATVDDNDELYPNGIFVFNITKMIAFISANPDKFSPELIDVNETRKFPTTSSLNEETIKTADISVPIILGEIAPDRYNVIDVNHRLERAFRDGAEKIPAYRVKVEYHIAFLTTDKGYKAYIDYWNSKIDDADE